MISVPEFNYWPFRVVWARQKGWLEVEDPLTGQWIEVWAKDAPRHWVSLAMEARDPRKIAAETQFQRIRRIRRISTLDCDALETQQNALEGALQPRRLPGYA